jgi:hypothetical protein
MKNRLFTGYLVLPESERAKQQRAERRRGYLVEIGVQQTPPVPKA